MQYLNPVNCHNKVMNVIDDIHQSKMPLIGKISAEMGLSLVAVITGVAAAAFETLKLALSIPTAIFAKYMVLGTIRLLTFNQIDALKKAYKALPGFVDCLNTAGRIINQSLGIVPSAAGAVLPFVGSVWNVHEQHRLGNCAIERKVKEEQKAKTDKYNALKAEIKTLQQQITQVDEEMNDPIPATIFEDDVVNAFQTELDRQAGEQIKLQNKKEALIQKLNKLIKLNKKDYVQILKDDVNELTREVSQKGQSINSLKAKHYALRHEINLLNDKKDELISENYRTINENNDLNEQLKKANVVLEGKSAEKSKLSAEILTLKGEIARFESEFKTAKEEIESKKSEIAKLQESITKELQNKSQLVTEKEDLAKKIAEMSGLKDVVNSEVEKLKSEATKQLEEKTQLNEKNTSLSKELTELKSKLAEKETEIENYKKTKDAQDKFTRKLAAEKNDLLTEKQKLQEELAKLQAKLPKESSPNSSSSSIPAPTLKPSSNSNAGHTPVTSPARVPSVKVPKNGNGVENTQNNPEKGIMDRIGDAIFPPATADNSKKKD